MGRAVQLSPYKKIQPECPMGSLTLRILCLDRHTAKQSLHCPSGRTLQGRRSAPRPQARAQQSVCRRSGMVSTLAGGVLAWGDCDTYPGKTAQVAYGDLGGRQVTQPVVPVEGGCR